MAVEYGIGGFVCVSVGVAHSVVERKGRRPSLEMDHQGRAESRAVPMEEMNY
jgi:hypothetical protein